MNNLYKGNHPCAGCGRTGAEKSRIYKDDLCYDCKELIRLGQGVKKESNNFARVFFHKTDSFLRSTYQQFDKKDSYLYSEQIAYDAKANDKLLESLEMLLKALHRGRKKETKAQLRIGENIHGRADEYYIESETALTLFNFIKSLAEHSKIIKKKGFEEGKLLLINLNQGKITLKELEERK